MDSAVLQQVRLPAVVLSVLSTDAAAVAGFHAVVEPRRDPTIVDPTRNVCAWRRDAGWSNDHASWALPVPTFAAFRRSRPVSANLRSSLGLLPGWPSSPIWRARP